MFIKLIHPKHTTWTWRPKLKAAIANSPRGINKRSVELLNLVSMDSVWEDRETIPASSRVSRLWDGVAFPHLLAFLKIAYGVTPTLALAGGVRQLATSLGLHALDAALAEQPEHSQRVDDTMFCRELCLDTARSSLVLLASMLELRARGIMLKVVHWVSQIIVRASSDTSLDVDTCDNRQFSVGVRTVSGNATPTGAHSTRGSNMSSTPRTGEILPAKSRGSYEADDPQQGIHRLPVELLDLVLQCLWEDKPAIIACSQVSRLWNEVAQPHLFAFLKIASRSDFVEFPASLWHAHPAIARHVRKLELKNAQRRISWTDHFAPLADFPEIDRAQLCALVAPLLHLQELHLYELCLLDSPGPAPDARDDLPHRTLEKLTLSRCRARAPGSHTPLATLLNLVSVFASVGTLELISMHLSDFLPARLIRPARVGALVTRDAGLSPGSEDELFEALRESLVPGCLRALQLGSLGHAAARDVGTVRKFGQLVGSAARDALHIHLPFFLTIAVKPREDDPEYWRTLNLQTCTSLQTLGLDLSIPPAESTHTPRVPLARVCIALLANMPSTVRMLVLKLWGLDAANWQVQLANTDRLGLRALDDALAGGRHDHLERVEVMLDARHCAWREECEVGLGEAMPRLRARGVLAVVDWVP
ncbi:uncharacterized protein TRAVEDRAFT_23044 [Trametes versicolor FP-101664 SS1]|uniref:uncharacterized protein n=1 Tax=Trametes versicolor (strain FP-101664) TaxID=717944 RepID=UPI0004621DF3|nr:uncharacterized protein TRAVEDRAFT_23044 [Trametes versicolor FP-101664 SS1]EIW55335.1 hypothetical protein TRAVEDRAFT_23044 [Trametes versicolor FP-101664 SS1]